MIFNKVRLRGTTDVDLQLENVNPLANFTLQGIDGLGPPPIDVAVNPSLYGQATYQGSRPQGRQIVIQVGLNPDYSSGETVESLRNTLYGMIAPGLGKTAKVMLYLDDTEIVETVGYVSEFDINPFSKDPAVVITYTCPSSYLSAPAPIQADLATLDKSIPQIINPGNAPTGFRLEIFFLADSNASQIFSFNYGFVPGRFSAASNVFMKVTRDDGFKDEDYLVIDTNPGSKEVSINGVNKLDKLSNDSSWIYLISGLNVFIVAGSINYDWVDFSFTPQYWGV